MGAEILFVNGSSELYPRMWRNTIIDDTEVDVFIVRDCDARLTVRDAIVVDDWLRQNPETAAVLHCVRDHPMHSKYVLLAGLWGARRALLSQRFNGRQVFVYKYHVNY